MSQNVPKCPVSNESNLGADPSEAALGTPQLDAALTESQEMAIALLLAGQPLADVAATVGIDRRTLYRWRHHDRAFTRALREKRAEQFDTATDRLRNLLDRALDTLQKQLADPYAQTSHRAARTLLALAQVGPSADPRRRQARRRPDARTTNPARLAEPPPTTLASSRH